MRGFLKDSDSMYLKFTPAQVSHDGVARPPSSVDLRVHALTRINYFLSAAARRVAICSRSSPHLSTLDAPRHRPSYAQNVTAFEWEAFSYRVR
jgi:hypothetical protein